MTFWRSAALSALALTLAGACSAEETPMPSQTPESAPAPAPATSTPATSTPPSTPASGPVEVLSIAEVSGLWSLRPETGEGRCRIALNKLPVAGGYGVQIESCTLAAVAGGQSWRPVEGGFELLGDQGRVLMRFRRVDANAFTAEGYRLTPAPMA